MYSVPFLKNPYYIYLTNPCASNLSPSVAIVLHPIAILILSSPGLASWDLAYVVALNSVFRRTHASFMLLPSWNSYFLNKQLYVFSLHWVSQMEPVLFSGASHMNILLTHSSLFSTLCQGLPLHSLFPLCGHLSHLTLLLTPCSGLPHHPSPHANPDLALSSTLKTFGLNYLGREGRRTGQRVLSFGFFLYLHLAVDGSESLILSVKFRFLNSVFSFMQEVWSGGQSPGEKRSGFTSQSATRNHLILGSSFPFSEPLF